MAARPHLSHFAETTWRTTSASPRASAHTAKKTIVTLFTTSSCAETVVRALYASRWKCARRIPAVRLQPPSFSVCFCASLPCQTIVDWFCFIESHLAKFEPKPNILAGMQRLMHAHT
ncbi:MAG: hypothetical protein EOO65_01940 [Methanosarcinales archaeon]|nr:MAG: hypothetical protein EOO65_01940 [Methanosarcinales archaeon]